MLGSPNELYLYQFTIIYTWCTLQIHFNICTYAYFCKKLYVIYAEWKKSKFTVKLIANFTKFRLHYMHLHLIVRDPFSQNLLDRKCIIRSLISTFKYDRCPNINALEGLFGKFNKHSWLIVCKHHNSLEIVDNSGEMFRQHSRELLLTSVNSYTLVLYTHFSMLLGQLSECLQIELDDLLLYWMLLQYFITPTYIYIIL